MGQWVSCQATHWPFEKDLHHPIRTGIEPDRQPADKPITAPMHTNSSGSCQRITASVTRTYPCLFKHCQSDPNRAVRPVPNSLRTTDKDVSDRLDPSQAEFTIRPPTKVPVGAGEVILNREPFRNQESPEAHQVSIPALAHNQGER